ncbi:M23 family metallopeptidase [Arthrobacter agilis]|uniref:M23 family metallopeptidase n=1 Tax=Arthrobacter agilis TaxID=37921 RepID=UPI00277F638B|nr:M23 family metallopeptidase [Arthrobacter agilis]MDQ0734174.1 murein DD-endopeptidase MepM/ murein hydrolase activator NlpD [Arthrobacter agilis]
MDESVRARPHSRGYARRPAPQHVEAGRAPRGRARPAALRVLRVLRGLRRRALTELLLGLLVVVLVPAGTGGSAAFAQDGPPAGRRLSPGPVPAEFVPEWSWPLSPPPAVLRPFERPPRPWQRGHRGVDLAVGTATTPVLSPADGIVSFAGTVVDRGVLSIDHGGGRISSFEPVTTPLVKGRRVTGGEVVAGIEGAGPDALPRGHCGTACLHWGVRVDGEYVDPLSFVMDRRPSVLLPLDGWENTRNRRGSPPDVAGRPPYLLSLDAGPGPGTRRRPRSR